MRRPTLCMIFEAIGPYSAIGKVAMNGVQIALEAGWQVTVVAQYLDESLHGKVEWLRLYVPPRLFFVQWTTARHFIKKALGGRTFDVIHAHQPQAAALSDVFQCHFLTRRAYERGCLESRGGIRSALVRLQEQGVLYAEDYCYRHWNPRTRMLYNSALTRQDFHRLYGRLRREEDLVCAFPPIDFPSKEERRRAREALIGVDYRGIVLGYLGGLHTRKGYRRLIAGLEGDNDIFLLMGGQYSQGFEAPTLKGRFKAVGLVNDTAAFYAACDVFAVPSRYEPLGLVAFEAAARGVPVIASEEVGALPHLLEYGAGAAWTPDGSLPALVCRVAANRTAFNAGALKMAASLGEHSYKERLLTVYENVLLEKQKSSADIA